MFVKKLLSSNTPTIINAISTTTRSDDNSLKLTFY